MALCPGLPRWAGTRKVKPIWTLLKQETVSGSGISWAICKSASHSRQTRQHPTTFTGQIPFLPPNQQRQSTEGISHIHNLTIACSSLKMLTRPTWKTSLVVTLLITLGLPLNFYPCYDAVFVWHTLCRPEHSGASLDSLALAQALLPWVSALLLCQAQAVMWSLPCLCQQLCLCHPAVPLPCLVNRQDSDLVLQRLSHRQTME